MKDPIQINFVLPFKSRRPAGGLRVMYEYANRLAELGYSIHLFYPIDAEYVPYRWPYFIRLLLSRIEGFRTYEWFHFHKNIKRTIIKCISDKSISDGDITIATWWATAVEISRLDESKGIKINLIQGYENWGGHVDQLHASYGIEGMTNVVVASYLQTLVKSYSANRTILIPNAIDTKSFLINNPIENRVDSSVCMIYSTLELKGSNYGLEALILVQKSHPNLSVEFFGICPEPKNLPDWIKFHRNPKDLNALYNRSSIFIANSLNEGMSLTPMEAMSAGCACILTDIQGHSEYAIDEETCLFYETKNIISLADKITELIENKNKRIKIAEKGNHFIQKFSWNNAVSKMDDLIRDLLKL